MAEPILDNVNVDQTEAFQDASVAPEPVADSLEDSNDAANERDNKPLPSEHSEKQDKNFQPKALFLNIAAKIKDFIKGAANVISSIGSRILLGKEAYLRELEKKEAIERNKTIASYDAKKHEQKQAEQHKTEGLIKEEGVSDPVTQKQNNLELPPELKARISEYLKKIYSNKEIHFDKVEGGENHKGCIEILVTNPKSQEVALEENKTLDERVSPADFSVFIDERGNVNINDAYGEHSQDLAYIVSTSIYEHNVEKHLQATLGRPNGIDLNVSRETNMPPHIGEMKIEAINKETQKPEYEVYIDKNGNISNLEKTENNIINQNKQIIATAIRDYDYKALGVDSVPSAETLKRDVFNAIEKLKEGEQVVKFAYQGVDFNIHKTDDNFVIAEATHTSLSGEVITVASEGPASIDSFELASDSVANDLRKAVFDTMAFSSEEFTREFIGAPEQNNITINNGDEKEYCSFVSEDNSISSHDDYLRMETELDRLNQELDDPELKDFVDANEYSIEDDGDVLSLI